MSPKMSLSAQNHPFSPCQYTVHARSAPALHRSVVGAAQPSRRTSPGDWDRFEAEQGDEEAAEQGGAAGGEQAGEE